MPAATGKDYVEWCGKLSGFGCRVRGNGHKTFVVMYRAGGRNAVPHKVTIGTYGKLTVDQARVGASKILTKVQLGEDVAAKRAMQRAEMTVSELCDEYMQEGVEHKKPTTIQSDISRIEAHIRPLLGRKRIGAVSRADVERFLHDVAQGRRIRDLDLSAPQRVIRKFRRASAEQSDILLLQIRSRTA